MKAEITMRPDARRRGDYGFRMLSAERPTGAEVESAQEDAGFHPAGYGPPRGVLSERTTDGQWVTTWRCNGSCD